MRITEAARRLGTSARMLRYREDLGLLPRIRDRPGGRPSAGRRTGSSARRMSRPWPPRWRWSGGMTSAPASLAFGLRVLTEPQVRAAVADLGRRLGRGSAPASRAVDFEKERALRLLGR